jgi:hypothetical protein
VLLCRIFFGILSGIFSATGGLVNAELCAADGYEALQINTHVVVVGKGQHQNHDPLVYFDNNVIDKPLCTLYHESPSLEVSKGKVSFNAYTSFEWPVALPNVLVEDLKGSHSIQVVQHPNGIMHAGGGELDLPVLPETASLDDAVRQMKLFDKRAVLMNTTNGYELFMNYQIARHYGRYSSMKDLRGKGQVVGAPAFSLGFNRHHLFAITSAGGPVAHVLTLFETVASSVANSRRVCLCTSGNHRHTVYEPPGVDKSPCVNAPPNHGVYDCF